ncbi:hypothetical protein AQ505_12440 [Pedobacter sp. PACM 27299]|uniref:type II toxin-antitoxin system toxin DNA ADP-ribosyl transferase DarT n=1 Tax=Pedobacter sp. PACM 27299 TaxID=1727164 RepID=UPI000706ADB1|nr:DUF4433 domain-containing protein [Pedobacter sp. PACM 27299]ALL06229.1 hypothetical protein AQ505_12440 [Pedobacter sp. PACM 27299]
MSKIPAKYAYRYMYHFTHIDNLPAILEHGLLCTNEKVARGLLHFNVAAEGIQERRHTMTVTCGPGGVVHDYVPFYLGAINPMFVSIINSKNVDQHEMIFFAVPIKILEEKGTVFTDASANTAMPPNFYADPESLDKLNWAAIDEKKWGRGTDDHRHQRMAEVLVWNNLPIDRIETIIVWNDHIKDKIIKMYKDAGLEPPAFSYSEFRGKRFFLFKFMVKGQENYSLITGPRILKSTVKKAIKEVCKDINSRTGKTFKFKDIYEALKKIQEDFCAVKELAGIYNLKTDNVIHRETVSDHTQRVVKNVLKSDFYKNSSPENQCILELSAYLHDIGKGPASKWKDGIQTAYPDHPADGVEMVARFLYEDVEELTEYQVRMIILLVSYHDLIGEILAPGRDEQQLKDIIQTRLELEMLSVLNRADVAALNIEWQWNFDGKIRRFIESIVEETGIE